MTVLDGCPSGYLEKDGDVGGVGTAVKSLTMQGCAKRCTEMITCLSFEYNSKEMNCFSQSIDLSFDSLMEFNII